MAKPGGTGSGVATPRWSLLLFGGFRLSTISGESVTLPGKRERILLAYLLLSPNCRQPRRNLADLLWGDTTDEAALHNLRTCVWGLRNALSDPERRLLISEGEEIALDASMFEVDARTFRRLALQPERQALETAACLYTGTFLDGLIIDSEEFESWRRAEAIHYRAQAIDVLTRLMASLSDDGEAERALEAGQRILSLDPMHEAAVREMMRIYAESGRRGVALQLYRSLADILRAELNVEPEPQTRSVLAKLSNVQGALTAAREKRPVIFGGTVPLTPPPSEEVSRQTVSMLPRSRLTVLGWIAFAAPILVIVLFSFQWRWSSQRPETSMPLGLTGESLVSNRDIDPASYQQFLYAKSVVQGAIGVFGPQPMVHAAALLEQVIARNPNYAPAWALLAQVYNGLPGATWNPGYQFVRNDDELQRNIQETLAKAERAAQQALRLDPKNADAYLALGRLRQSRGKLVEAEELLSKAFQLDPNNPGVLNQYSALLGEVGRPTAALSMQEQLHALEAFVPNISMSRARFLWLNGENDAAIEIFKTLPNGRPNNNIAKVFASMGRFSEAARLLAEDAAAPNPPEWTQAAARLLLAAPANAVSPEELPRLGLTESYIYAYVGAPGRVLEPYEEVAETGYAPNVYIAYVTLLWHPVYSTVRKTERFKAFARKIGLVDYWRFKGWPDLCRPQGADDFVCD